MSYGVMKSDQAPLATWPPQIGPEASPPQGWKGVPYALPEAKGMNVGGALGALQGLAKPVQAKPAEPMMQSPMMQLPKHRPIPLNPVLLGLLANMSFGLGGNVGGKR